MVMTEKMLAELLEAVKKRGVMEENVKIVEKELRERLAIGTLPQLGWAGAHEIDYDALEGV